jgi:para-aminobenzoate synthetase component I
MTLTNKMASNFFEISSISVFKEKAFSWAAQPENAFSNWAFLDNNGYTEGFVEPEFECLLGLGSVRAAKSAAEKNAFENLGTFLEKNAQPAFPSFGFLTYDLKNDLEDLNSENFDGLEIPSFHFFEPEILLKMGRQKVEVLKHPNLPKTSVWFDVKPREIFEQIENTDILATPKSVFKGKIEQRFTEKEYLETVETIQEHIQKGDIFEMNFCQEFYAEHVEFDPVTFFLRLNRFAKAPFSAFYKLEDQYLACASPERYLKKTGQKLTSQPIKGTAPRGATPEEDQVLKQDLKADRKNRSENVMIVDLVRNDLGKVAQTGSVQVSELFGVYTFPTVHQLISTVEATLQPHLNIIDVLRASFPMGSMTGAPKVRALQLIEQYEKTRRGLYSGAVGYISENGDFDFNVVIRSVLYDAKKHYLSFQVGSAIVADSVPKDEYAECFTKIQGILRTLSS